MTKTDNNIVFLLVISAIGFVLSVVIHLFAIFRIFDMPRWLIIITQVGGFFVVYASWIISRNLRNKGNIKDFKKAIRSVCPEWLSIMTGLFIMYAFVGLIFFVVRRYFAGSTSTNTFTGHLIALYSLAFTLLYSCRRLRKA